MVRFQISPPSHSHAFQWIAVCRVNFRQIAGSMQNLKSFRACVGRPNYDFTLVIIIICNTIRSSHRDQCLGSANYLYKGLKHLGFNWAWCLCGSPTWWMISDSGSWSEYEKIWRSSFTGLDGESESENIHLVAAVPLAKNVNAQIRNMTLQLTQINIKWKIKDWKNFAWSG